jgi:hypothetical protein
MIGPNSRYANVEVASTQAIRNGVPVEIRYLRRRFIPPVSGGITIVRYTIKQGDRVDNLSARFLGDPTQFWRLADVNVVLRPTELTDTLGQRIQVVVPFGAGAIR